MPISNPRIEEEEEEEREREGGLVFIPTLS